MGASWAPVWAAIITSTVSLAGIVAGFVWNADLQRKAEERKLQGERQRETEKLDQERNNLRAALIGELESVIKTYEDELNYVSGDWTWFPL